MTAHAIRPSNAVPRPERRAATRLRAALAATAGEALARFGRALVIGGPAGDAMVCAAMTPLGVSVWYARRTTA